MTGAQITLAEDLNAVVETALTDMLNAKGFRVAYEVPESAHSRLRVDIQGLQYDTSTGFWTGGVEVAAALKATAVNEFETYENFYRYGHEDRVVFVPGAGSNSQRINAAPSDVLHQVVADRRLLEVLAEERGSFLQWIRSRRRSSLAGGAKNAVLGGDQAVNSSP